MAKEELTTREIEAAILHKLARRGAWGEAYIPHDTLVRRMAKKIKKDGRRIRKILDVLIKEGYLIPHKGGKTVSLNPSRKVEILMIVKDYLEA